MKRTLLFLLMMICIMAYSQEYRNGFRGVSDRMPATQLISQTDEEIIVDPLTTGVKVSLLPPERTLEDILDPTTTGVTVKIRPPERNLSDFVNPLPIGQAGNAFGFAFTRNTFLWADQDINTITFIHRMNTTPGTGYLAYDISKDGGQTWTPNVQVYDPTLPEAFNGRYPQGGIYNPAGNTNPDNAYFHYFAPTLDGSNTGGENNWGGYAHGVRQLADGSVPTQTNRTSVPPYYQYLPAGFTITQTGEAWMVDENSIGNSSGFTYEGNLILGHGLWDEALSDFVYYYELLPLEIDPDDDFNDWKIAFSPDGQTGWIMCLTNLVDNLPYTTYHPVLFRTTDAGATWDGPFEVQLGGEDGLEPIKQFITDEALAAYFDPEPVPPRDEIDYFIGYEGDLAVDAWGNPHIAGTVCIADNAAGLIYPNEGWMAMFHIWSEDLGQTWKAFNLSDLKRWDAEFTDGAGSTISMYNRPQVATTQDGIIVFFSWLDTENPDVDDNTQPDIFFREYFPATDLHGEFVENVTTFSAAMWSAFFGCMSHYVFSEINGDQYTCTIPFVYEEMTNFDPSQPVQFYYIPDYVKVYTNAITGIKENPAQTGMKIAQNFPNPANTVTNIRVDIPYDSKLELQVYNLAGSLVYTDNLNDGRDFRTFKINPAHWSPGIYFYKINSEFESLTGKMVVSH